MAIFCRAQRCQILLSVIVISLLAFTGGAPLAVSAEQTVVQSLQAGHRPANLYSVLFQSDRSICGPIVMSLNRPLDMTNFDDHPDLASDLLLGSDLQVPWQRKLTPLWTSLDYAQIDIANDGRSMAVYRRGHLVNEKRSENDLYILTRPIESWSVQDHLPDDTVKVLGEQSELPLYDYNRGPYESIIHLLGYKDRSLAADHFNLNLLSVHGRSILILTGANESHYGVFEGQPFYVFALLYHMHGAPSLVCEFHASA